MEDRCNYYCENDKICHLEDDINDGWCTTCNKCKVHDCREKIAYRLYWKVKAGESEFLLFKDVCKKHFKNYDPPTIDPIIEKYHRKFIYKFPYYP